MDLEVQTLRYYLSLFSVIIFLLYSYYIIQFQFLFKDQHTIRIIKGDSVSKISENIIIDKNYLQKNIYYLLIVFSNRFISPINYGDFLIEKNSNILSVLRTISKASNVNYEITIIEGWEKYQLTNYLNKFFIEQTILDYDSLLADTYYINSSDSLKKLFNLMDINKKRFFDKFKNNELYNLYSEKEILIISSLIEKEAKNSEDKKLIASVILNRLKKNMRLQIDATVIFALTEGKFKLNRKLTLLDLKTQHPFNTYYIYGLPPDLISYVGPETIKIVLENPKSDYLFYFYNVLEKKHIFSKNYERHKFKLNEYRKKI